MNPEQILGLRDQLHDNNGDPLAGGSIDVFAAGTTTRVTTYSDSDLNQLNANPVPLNGSGRASIWLAVQEVDIRVLDAEGTLITEELGLNPSNVDGGFDGGLVANGSFELDSDADDVPDGWLSENNAAGSNNGLETGAGNTGAGAQSWRTQSSGNGGGELVTANPFEVNDFDDLVVRFVLRSTVAAVRNIVRVEWYDVSDTLISNTDVYDSTANPATFTQQTFTATPPAGARLARIRIFGGATGGTVAGITYWDNFNVQYPPVVVGQFDNILIAGNTISSTDTDGDIILAPDGTGAVQVTGGAFEVTPNADFAGTVTIQGALTGATGGFSGALTADSLATVQGIVSGSTLGVVGNSDLDGTLDVQGAVNFQAGLTVGADLTVNGATNFVGGFTSLSGITAAFFSTAGVGAFGTVQVTTNQPVDLTDDVASVRIGPPAAAHMEMDVQTIQAKSDTTVATTLQLNPLGGQLVLGELAANSTFVRLRHQSTIIEGQQTAPVAFRNQTDGNPAITAAQDVAVRWQNSGGTDLAEAGFVGGTTTFRIRSLHRGGPFQLSGVSSGGGTEVFAQWQAGLDAQLNAYTQAQVTLQDPTAGDNSVGARVRHRDELTLLDGLDVGVGEFPPVNIAAARTIGTLDVQRLIRVTAGTGAITFDNDNTIADGAYGMLVNEGGGAITLTQGAGVTITHLSGSGALVTGNRTWAVGGFVFWLKESDTAFWVWGFGIT